ncbi:DNA recombination protein RmuC, partial [Candidatus Wolfebacteria bacterium]|nr:DNA recombination protein RmuC [Candidatus Wolfebacteria bacterium]
MEIILLIAVVILAIGLGLFILVIKKRLDSPKNDQSLLLLQNQMNEIVRTLDYKLGESTTIMQRQFDQSSRIIREITAELTRVGEGQKQVVDIARQLENLQDILKNPKQRGVLGEYYLEAVMKNVLPPG